jgi:tRNA/tmRNA/rRNA uracil-C5-methylase (TrmA/RlmC/RlmD family)
MQAPISDQAPLSYHQEVELQIETLTNLGLGLGRIDNWVVMVPFCLPGEYVKVRIFRNHKNYSEADLVAILKPSAERIQPICPLFGKCGGCQYQHMNYGAQLLWKQNQVKELLVRLAGIEVEIQPTWPSPEIYQYRSKITPHFKTNKADKPLNIGFLEQGTRSRLVDVPYCPIAMPQLNETLTQERFKLQQKPIHTLRAGTLLLRNAIEGVVTNPKQIVTEQIGPHTYKFVAGAFFQNNPYILKDFVSYSVKEAKGPEINFFADIYCGVGVFTIAGHDSFTSCMGVEIDSEAIRLARENAAANHAHNCTFVSGSAEAIFNHIPYPAEQTSVLLDPPRKGCDEQFLSQLLAYRPRKIVYVSCAPDTQARDLKVLLAANYKITRVQPFDLFPQTRHIENVVTLQLYSTLIDR